MFNKDGQKHKLIRGASVMTLFAYLTFLAWRMFFYAYANYHRIQASSHQYNLIPFKTILDFLGNSHNYGFTYLIYNLLGNIIVFIPLGLLLTLALKKHSMKSTLGISFVIIAVAELMQLVTRLGVFDADDIILNLSGCLLGYALGSLIRKRI